MFMFPQGLLGVPEADPKGTHTKLYETLGVNCDATPAQIKKAFRRMSVRHHPDKGGDASLYQEITHAYDVLGDNFKRRVYDDYGEEGLESEVMQGAVRRKMKKQLEPVNVHIRLSLEECMKTHSKKVSFKRITVSNGNMSTKDVNVHVDLPLGLTNGQVIKVEEQGNFIEDSKTDLMCHIELKEHSTFKVQGFELLLERDISFVAAMLGCVYTIPTLDEPEFAVVIPPLSVFRDPVRTVEEKGLPLRDTGIRGSLHIKFNIDYSTIENATISKELGILLRDELDSSPEEQVGGSVPEEVMESATKSKMYNSDEVKRRMELARDLDGSHTRNRGDRMREMGGMSIPGMGGMPFPIPGMGVGGMEGVGGMGERVECATQ